MRYVSTRGGAKPQAFTEILLEGLAPDGGLFLPEEFPKFSPADLSAMRGTGYRELAKRSAGLNFGNSSGRKRSEEHTSELQSLTNLVCRLLLEKKKKRLRNHAVQP